MDRKATLAQRADQDLSETVRYISFLILIACLAGCSQPPPTPHSTGSDADAAFTRLADEYIAGYLAWRPQTGTALGLHQYDGRVTDYSQRSLDAELARLKSFNQRLSGVDTNRLSQQGFYDYRILRSSIQREMFSFEQAEI